MKKAPLLLYFILLMLVFHACKKDEDLAPETSLRISYDGIPYEFTEGVILDYGTEIYRPNHFSHAYLIPNRNVFNRGSNYTIPTDDPPLTLAFFLSTPNSETFKPGTYEFIEEFTDWGSPESYEAYLSRIQGKYMISDVVVGFDENGDNIIDGEEKHGITSGHVIVTEEFLEFDLTLTNGSKVTGKANPRFEVSLPSA